MTTAYQCATCGDVRGIYVLNHPHRPARARESRGPSGVEDP